MFHTKILNAHVSYTDVYVIPYFPPNTKVSVHVSNTTPHTPRSVFMFQTLLHTHQGQCSYFIHTLYSSHTKNRSVFMFHTETLYSSQTKNRSVFIFHTDTLLLTH